MKSVRETAPATMPDTSQAAPSLGIEYPERSTNVNGSGAIRMAPLVTGNPGGAGWPEQCGPRQGASLGAAGHRSQVCGMDRVRMVRFDEVSSDLFDGATAATV
jgi:hypothetical protein